MYQAAMKARMSELEQQKAEIETRLEDAPADLPDVHPNIAEHHRAKVVRLAETLAEPEANVETREDIRSLIGEVVITPGEKRGESHAVLRGELMATLDLVAGRWRTPRPEIINKGACRSPQPRLVKTPAISKDCWGFYFGVGTDPKWPQLVGLNWPQPQMQIVSGREVS
jgi:site-specific DNA recombinase